MIQITTQRKKQAIAILMLATFVFVVVKTSVNHEHMNKGIQTTNNATATFGVKPSPKATSGSTGGSNDTTDGSKSLTTRPSTYSTEPPQIPKALVPQNDQKQTLINFYASYGKNKDNLAARQDLIKKYGDENFIKNNQPTPDYDPVVCGTDYPDSASIDGSIGDDSRSQYSLGLLSPGFQLQIQAVVVKVNNSYLIDNIICPGSV
jgi:hypothetical protein